MSLLRFYGDGDYSQGMIRDVASWELPPGSVYDAQNYLWTKPGAARMRMGSTALFSGTQSDGGSALGFCYSQDSATTIEELYVAPDSSSRISRVNTTTGVYTTIATAITSTATVGRPTQHFGFLVFSATQALVLGPRLGAVVAGITSNTSFSNSANATVTANSGTVTLSGGDTTTNVKVGAVVTLVVGTNIYQGRVVSITDSTHFVSWPPMTFSGTAAAGAALTAPYIQQAIGGCATSFQNRLVYGNVVVSGSTPLAVADRRLMYSPLPTESYLHSSGFTYSGMAPAFSMDLIPLNYIDVPGTGPFVALEPVADNQLLILTTTRPVLLRGNLITQLATTSPTVTFDISEIQSGGTCISDRGVQRTPKGVVWAGYGGVYLWTGNDPLDLTGDRENKLVNSYWRSLTGSSTFALYGSAFADGHLILHGTSGGAAFSLACDMTGSRPKWGRLAGAGTDLYMSAPRPSVPSQVFGLRHAASYVGGQVVRIDPMFKPYVTGASTLDSDGNAVATTLTTRPIGGDQATQKMWQSAALRYAAEMDTAAVTVTAQSKTDAADINTGSVRALGSLSSTATRTITAATNASPIAITTSAVHGLQTDDFVNVDAVTGNTAANGRWRITVTGTTTFTLNGTAGNANYVSGGQVQRVTEASFQLSGLNKGQAASLTIASSGTVKNLEIQGLKLGALEVAIGVVS